MLAMDHYSRRIVGFAVQAPILDGPAVCRMFNSIIAGRSSPRYLSSDNDPLFAFHGWKANLRILSVSALKAVPYVPLSHPFVERRIGTIRREFLDHLPFWNARDLERKLLNFKGYYNCRRGHYSLGGVTPSARFGETPPKVSKLDN